MKKAERSTSLENNLKDFLDLIKAGELTQCRKNLDKRISQTKNKDDLFALNIINLVLNTKTYNYSDYLLQRDVLIETAITTKNEQALYQLKIIFLQIHDNEAYRKVLLHEYSTINLELITQSQLDRLLREFLYDGNFSFLYKAINKLNKNVQIEKSILSGLRGLCMYELGIKTQALPKMFVDKEYESLKTSKFKGSSDLLIKYHLANENFEEVLQIEDTFSRSPLSSIKQEILWKAGRYEDLLLLLSTEVLNKLEKLEFNLLERLVNLSVFLKAEGKAQTIEIAPINEVNTVLSFLVSINKSDKLKHFYARKSFKLAILLYLSQSSQVSKLEQEELFVETFKETLILFEQKQGSLPTIRPFIQFLSNQHKKDMIGLFNTDLIYYHRLNSLFFPVSTFEELVEVWGALTTRYKQSSLKSLKIGERQDCDEFLELANEILLHFEVTADINLLSSVEYNELLYKGFCLTEVAYKASSYNFDLGLQLCRYCRIVNSYDKLQITLLTMNIKNVQFEALMYLFINVYQLQGFKHFKLSYEAYRQDCFYSFPAVLQKMISEGNYYDFEETRQFSRNASESHESIIFALSDALINGTDDSAGYGELLRRVKEEVMVKNSDVLTALPRFVQLEGNNKGSYRFSFDELGKNQRIYGLVPGDFSNWVEQNEIKIFGAFDSMNFIGNRLAQLSGSKEELPTEMSGNNWESELFGLVDNTFNRLNQGSTEITLFTSIYALLTAYLQTYEIEPHSHRAKRIFVDSFYASVRFINIPLIRLSGNLRVQLVNQITNYFARITKSSVLKTDAGFYVPLSKDEIKEIKETCTKHLKKLDNIN